MSYDTILEQAIEDEKREFVHRLVSSIEHVVQFVARRLGWDTSEAKFIGVQKDSFIASFVIGNVHHESKVLIRFPVPGPYTRPGSRKRSPMSPYQLGPFLILEFMAGTSLDTLSREPAVPEDERFVLNPSIDETKLGFVYDKIAGFLLQLARRPFSRTRAIEGTEASRRPVPEPVGQDAGILGRQALLVPSRIPWMMPPSTRVIWAAPRRCHDRCGSPETEIFALEGYKRGKNEPWAGHEQSSPDFSTTLSRAPPSTFRACFPRRLSWPLDLG
ncbi:hypothetical protein VTK73DRAFT_8655 [Phialemonium thermophilum]|uniref:Uncharacterized protein n=1 Tax=Phialemonium thermophilum TaxID=223376 RepID=A0ABR3XN00_9PEZI